MVAALVSIFAAFVTFITGYIFRRNGLRPVWSLLAFPVLMILFWVGGAAWIFSPYCGDIQTCDSGGFLAFTVGVAVILAIGVISSIFGLLALRIIAR